MRELYFNLTTASKNLLINKNRKMNLLVLLCLTVGFVLPVFCLANVNTFVEDFSTMRLKVREHGILLYGNFEKGDLLRNTLDQFEIGARAYLLKTEGTIQFQETGYENRFVYGISESFFAYEQFTLQQGRMLTADDFEKGNAVGLIEKSFLANNGISDMDIPFEMIINNTAITIVGSFSSMNHYTKLFLPERLLEKMTLENPLMIETVYGQYHGKEELSRMLSKIADAPLPIREIITAEEAYRRSLTNGWVQVSAVLLIALVSFLFSGINITLIITGKMVHMKKKLAIRKALGASYGDLMLTIFFENLMLSTLALLISFATVKICIEYAPAMMNFVLNFRVYILSFLLCFLETGVITAIIGHIVLKKDIAHQLNSF